MTPAGQLNRRLVLEAVSESDDGIGVGTGRFNVGIAWYPSAGNGTRK